MHGQYVGVVTVRAVLTPPQEEAFREVCAVEGGVETHFHGWSKRVISTADRVFLFPRDHTKLSSLEREAAALHALDGCAHVPRLIAQHDDERISPYPFIELDRIAGSPFYGEVYEHADLDVALDLMSQLGPAIAEWHTRSTEDLPSPLRGALPRPRGLLERAFVDDPVSLVGEAAAALAVPVAAECVDVIDEVQSMSSVLTHGDVHGEQLMVDAGTLTGVIDWETAAIDNPVRDFDFREWGRGWFRAHEHDFAALRERVWTSYSEAREPAGLPGWQTVHLFFSFVEAWQCATSDRDFDIERRPITLANLVAASA
jgi:aminoglycoside phosphotransferase (APT) family kinase protein